VEMRFLINVFGRYTKQYIDTVINTQQDVFLEDYLWEMTNVYRKSAQNLENLMSHARKVPIETL
jgi:hypothetical protein